MSGSGLSLLTGTRKFWFPHVRVVLSLNKMFCEDRAKKRRGQEMGEEMRGRTNWSVFQYTVFSRTGLQLSGTAPALGAGSQRKTMFWPFVQWRPYLHTEGFSHNLLLTWCEHLSQEPQRAKIQLAPRQQQNQAKALSDMPLHPDERELHFQIHFSSSQSVESSHNLFLSTWVGTDMLTATSKASSTLHRC